MVWPGALAMSRYEMLAPHLLEGVPLAQLAAAQDEGGVSYRTLQRWLADYLASRPGRLDPAGPPRQGLRRFPDELVAFIEGLTLRNPRPSAARERHRSARGLRQRHDHRATERSAEPHPELSPGHWGGSGPLPRQGPANVDPSFYERCPRCRGHVIAVVADVTVPFSRTAPP